MRKESRLTNMKQNFNIRTVGIAVQSNQKYSRVQS